MTDQQSLKLFEFLFYFSSTRQLQTQWGIFLGAKCRIWCLKESGDSFLHFFCIYWSTLIKVLPCCNIWSPYLFGIRKYPWYLRMLTSGRHQLIQGLGGVQTTCLEGQGLVVNVGQWNKVPELFWVLWMVSWLQGLCGTNAQCTPCGPHMFYWWKLEFPPAHSHRNGRA